MTKAVTVRPDSQYIRFDPFEGDRDVDVKERTVKVVMTRSEHPCSGNRADELHILPVGTRARYEHALVDGQWESYWYCTDFIDRWFKEIGE